VFEKTNPYMMTRSTNTGDLLEHRLLSSSPASFFSEFSWAYEGSSIRSGYACSSPLAPVAFSVFLCYHFGDTEVEVYDVA